MNESTPREIVEQLDAHIVGQRDAKRAIAVAIRNRWRRQRVEESMRDEIGPKNVMMIGPTGVGKTEIARRLASLTGAPFVKVDATKYTEVGYHGSDVESMVRELIENAISMVREEERKTNEVEASAAAERRLVSELVDKFYAEERNLDEFADSSDDGQVETDAPEPEPIVVSEPTSFSPPPFDKFMTEIVKIKGDPSSPDWFKEVAKTVNSLMKPESDENQEQPASEKKVEVAAKPKEDAKAKAKEQKSKKDALRRRVTRALEQGKLEEETIKVSQRELSRNRGVFAAFPDDLSPDMLAELFQSRPSRRENRQATVAEARKIFFDEELDKLLNEDDIRERAVDLAENLGVIFIDEIDKIVGAETSQADVSRMGVQRDLLPIVEGTTIRTRYGLFSTKHVLFIAAGAFHRVKPSDLTPELQGRFPIRVELSALKKEDFVRILTEPKNALTRQYVALMKTENIELVFEQDAIEAIADYAEQANLSTQNIGARRLYTIMERLLEDLNFEAAGMSVGRVVINAAYVKEKLDSVVKNEDLSKFIL